MICASLSDLISRRHARRKFVYHVNLCRCYACDHVTLYADNVYVHYIDRHVWFVPSSQLQDTLRRESQRSYAVRLTKINSVSASNLASHRVVICGALSGILHSRHRRCHRLLLLLSRTTSTVSRASRRKIARFKNSFMSRTSYEPSGIVISALFVEIEFIVQFL